MNKQNRPELIVALDVDTLAQAKKVVNTLYPEVRYFKVGSQLFTACGPEMIRFLRNRRAKVFLDLKFHDIPNTVANAAAKAVRLGVDIFNLHILGGEEMIRAAVKAAHKQARALRNKCPLILGVTVLTSQKASVKKVLSLARLAKKSGLDGVVASVGEAAAIRRCLGRSFVVLTPGIRSNAGSRDDQKRTATPQAAKKSGADFIVVGRPIVKAKSPLSVAEEILGSLK